MPKTEDQDVELTFVKLSPEENSKMNFTVKVIRNRAESKFTDFVTWLDLVTSVPVGSKAKNRVVNNK